MKLTDSNRPMRVLDKVLKGGLGAGNLGVVMSRHGLGKMAVLTSIALDHSMDGRNTLHVAIGESVGDIRAYHDEVLQAILTSLAVPNKDEIMTQVERHKQIYTFRDGNFTLERLRETLDFLRGGPEFAPVLVELQGWPDFEKITAEEVSELREIAKKYECEIWIPAHTHREDGVNEQGLPEYISRFSDDLSVLIGLEPQSDHVKINVLKAHESPVSEGIHLELDPKTLLIRWR